MDGASRTRIEPQQDPELRVSHQKGGLRRPHRNYKNEKMTFQSFTDNFSEIKTL